MELDCQRCDEGLVEFLYGDLDESEAAAFRRHIESCTECAAAAQQLQGTRDLFTRLEPAPVPLGLDDAILAAAEAKAEEMALAHQRIQNAAAHEPESDQGWWSRLVESFRGAAWRPAIGTVVALILVAGVGLVFLEGRPDDMMEPTRERLAMVPREEVRTSTPAARPAPPIPQPPIEEPSPPPPGPSPDEAEGVAEQALSPTPPAARNEHARVAVRPRPPRGNAESATGRPDPAAQPAAEGPPARDAREAQRRGGLADHEADGERGEPGLNRGASSSPLVVEAQPVPATPASLEGEALSGVAAVPEPPAPGQATPPPPVVPTPPMPGGAGAVDREAYRHRQQPGNATDDAVAQAPSPAPQAPSAPPAAPARVESSGTYDRGMDAYRAGRYRDAADELNLFVRSPSAPRNLLPSGMHHLGLSQQRSGNLGAAARTFDQLLSGYPSYRRRPQAMLEAARIHARLGNFARAEGLLRQLEAIPGWNAQASSEMARIQHRRAGQDGTMGPESAFDAAEESADEPAAVEAEESETGY